MNARALHGRRQPRQRVGGERQSRLEYERAECAVRRKERQRDGRHVTLLAAQACPERGVDDRFDGIDVGFWREACLAALARHEGLVREVRVHTAGDGAGRRI